MLMETRLSYEVILIDTWQMTLTMNTVSSLLQRYVILSADNIYIEHQQNPQMPWQNTSLLQTVTTSSRHCKALTVTD
jgi:hypothetical protein